MRTSIIVSLGLLCWQGAAPAQTVGESGLANTDAVGGDATANVSSYAAPTRSERWRSYFISAFGPGAIARAAAAGGIEQWEDTPKEWRQGSEAFGERVGNSFAEHVIRRTLESGAAAVLHEDNRYYRSTDTGFWKRTKHAVGSVLVTRNTTGGERFAFSRLGGAAGASFISRTWQPPSTTSAGDGAVNFGLTVAIDMGWNMFKEFRPAWMGRRF